MVQVQMFNVCFCIEEILRCVIYNKIIKNLFDSLGDVTDFSVKKSWSLFHVCLTKAELLMCFSVVAFLLNVLFLFF